MTCKNQNKKNCKELGAKISTIFFHKQPLAENDIECETSRRANAKVQIENDDFFVGTG